MVLVAQGTQKKKVFLLSRSKYFFLASISPIVVVILHMLPQEL
jgi:hypothetical protein